MVILVVAHEPTRCLGFQGFSTAIFSVKCSVYDISMTSETRETNPKHAPNEGLEPSTLRLKVWYALPTELTGRSGEDGDKRIT